MTDWLTEFPLAEKPDSWTLNSLFLQKLKELEGLWHSEGYTFQWGSELEFQIAENEDVSKAIKENSKLREDVIRPLRTSGPYQSVLRELRAYFKTEDGQALLQETGHNLKEALAYIRKFERLLKSDDPKDVSRARAHIFLAHIHTRTFGNGGLRDIIEPRFGDEGYGIGWLDVMGPEIRTRILGSAFNIISHYHKYLAVLEKEAAKFGLRINLPLGDPQLHMSVIRVADNKNMMKMEDENSIAFCERALAGYYQALQATSFMILDYDILTPTFDFHAGTDRTNYIRMEPDNWEFRRGQSTKKTHIARHLMVILMGMAYGCLHHPDQVNNLRPERLSHPLVKHPTNPLSGLASVLEHSVISKEGQLQPDIDLIQRVLWRLKDEIGEQHLNGYTVHPPLADALYYTLTHPYGWFRLIGELKITSDDRLDLSAIDHLPEVKAAFQRLNIMGRRNSLRVSARRLETELHTLEKNIHSFRSSAIGKQFFTPAEQEDIAVIYRKQPEHICKEAGDNIVDILKATLPSARRHFSEFAKKLPPSVDMDIPAMFVSNRIYVINLLWPAIEVDGDEARIRALMNIVQENKSIPRSFFINQTSYFHYLKKAFLAGIDSHIHLMEQGPDRGKKFLKSLKTCRDIFNGYMKETILTMQAHIRDDTKQIISGDIFRERGADIQYLSKLYEGKSRNLYGFFAMALQDSAYPDADIIRDLDTLVAEVREDFIACEELMDKVPERQLTLFTFRLYKDRVMQNLEDIRSWAHKNLHSPYAALPSAPPQTFTYAA